MVKYFVFLFYHRIQGEDEKKVASKRKRKGM